jgi:hypothetical protein
MHSRFPFVWSAALVLGLSVASSPSASAAPTGNAAYTDPAKTDADFAFQGEYAGMVPHDGQPVPFGVQVIALGDGTFDVVAYPGGLPGDGWTPPNKIKGTGVLTGEGDAALVKVKALDWGGNTRTGEIRDGAVVVLSDSGSEIARLRSSSMTVRMAAATRPSSSMAVSPRMAC